MPNSQHCFTSSLLRLCFLLCIIPTNSKAQLFGGMIKAQKPYIPATITLAQNQSYFVASVYDTDYQPYTAPTGTGTTDTQAADGTPDGTVDRQGSITTTGVTISIPVTATGTDPGTLPAYSTSITIPASLTQDGISRNLTLSWQSQTYTSTTTSITATIAAVGGTLNAKKLDINAGIGIDNLGVLLAQLEYPYNNDGNTTTYSVRIMPGISDKMFGLADLDNEVRHNFLYFPVTAEDGKVWLNNNLGADYANINSDSFNPTQQATALDDYHAYGSFFEWGRKPDGHELITWSSGTKGKVVKYTTMVKTNEPINALFITAAGPPMDWRIDPDDNLWATEASANNPCPSGFRVPTLSEINTLVTDAGITNDTSAASSSLHFANAGYRSGTGSINKPSLQTIIWSCSPYEENANSISFFSTMTVIYYNYRTQGNTVRCIQN